MVHLNPPTDVTDTFSWEDLLTLLRDELQEYGGLVGLLGAQQEKILNREPEALLEVNRSVQDQMAASQILQDRRRTYVSSLASRYGKEVDSTLTELLPCFPEVTRPMFESIVEEINNLVHKVRRKVDQNHRLLSRLTEVTDHILAMADPAGQTKTYDRRGDLSRVDAPGRSTLEENA